MWVCLSDCFLSIVNKDSVRGSLLVRARRQGDIEKIFPTAKVVRVTVSDYLYRASVPVEDIVKAMESEVRRITYSNFKGSVTDKKLHDAYMRVWTAMSSLQNPAPYSGNARGSFFSHKPEFDLLPKTRKRQKKAAAKKK